MKTKAAILFAAFLCCFGALAQSRTNLWLTWSNSCKFVVTGVEYKTNLSGPWMFYGYVTNGFTNQAWMKIDATNSAMYFRLYNLGIW